MNPYFIVLILLALVVASSAIMVWQVATIPDNARSFSEPAQQLFDKAGWVLSGSLGGLLGIFVRPSTNQ